MDHSLGTENYGERNGTSDIQELKLERRVFEYS